MQHLTTINLYGLLGEHVGKTWKFNVQSVSEAIHAIDVSSNYKFSNFLIQEAQQNVKYKLLINGKLFQVNNVKCIDTSNYNLLYQSEMVMKHDNIDSIDIVPLIEGSDTKSAGILTVILGIILIIIGIFTLPAGVGVLLIGMGLTLVIGGITSLLTKPPPYEEFRTIQQDGSKKSYLFSGPEQTIGEGGPVPIGYGRLIVGSQVISASYRNYDYGPYGTEAAEPIIRERNESNYAGGTPGYVGGGGAYPGTLAQYNRVLLNSSAGGGRGVQEWLRKLLD